MRRATEGTDFSAQTHESSGENDPRSLKGYSKAKRKVLHYEARSEFEIEIGILWGEVMGVLFTRPDDSIDIKVGHIPDVRAQV